MPFGAKSIEDSLMKVRPRGMTPITYSLKQAVQRDFLGFTGKKHIILLTDGGENCDESPCKYAMELIKTRRDIVIDVIAFAMNNSDDLEQLQCAALVTRGRFYNAQTAAELAKSMHNSVYKGVEAKIIVP
jgi:Ca-activated chloride channel family protein